MDPEVSPDNWPDGSAEFASYLSCRLEKHQALVDALVASREAKNDAAVHAVMTSAAVTELLDAWGLWEDWSAASDADGDLPLIPYLGEERMMELWYALWGARAYPEPGGGYDYVV